MSLIVERTYTKARRPWQMKGMLERFLLGLFSLLLLGYGVLLLVSKLNYAHQPKAFGGALLLVLIGLAAFWIATLGSKETTGLRRRN